MTKPETNPAKTILTISVGFIIVYIITKWQSVILISLVIGLIGILSPYLSAKIEFLWMKLTSILGLIVPNILLGIVFYLFLLPISTASKLFGKKDPLTLKNKPGSMFKERAKQLERMSFEKPW